MLYVLDCDLAVNNMNEEEFIVNCTDWTMCGLCVSDLCNSIPLFCCLIMYTMQMVLTLCCN